MKHCANCGTRIDCAINSCTYMQVVNQEKYKNKNAPMMIRVAYFCCAECLGVYLGVNGVTEHMHHTRIVEV